LVLHQVFTFLSFSMAAVVNGVGTAASWVGNLGIGAVRSTGRIVGAPVRYAYSESMAQFPEAHKFPARLCAQTYTDRATWPRCLDKDGKECDESSASWFSGDCAVNLPGADDHYINTSIKEMFMVYHNGGSGPNGGLNATEVHVAIRGTAAWKDLVPDLAIFVAQVGSRWGNAKELSDFKEAVTVVCGIIKYFDIPKPDSQGKQSKQLYLHGHSLVVPRPLWLEALCLRSLEDVFSIQERMMSPCWGCWL